MNRSTDRSPSFTQRKTVRKGRPPCQAPRLFLLTPTYIATAALAYATPLSADESGTSLLGLLQQGGWAMWPLGICCLALFFLFFHAFTQTRRARFLPDAAIPDISRRLSTQDIEGVRPRLKMHNTVLTRCIHVALDRVVPSLHDTNREDVEAQFLDAVDMEESGVAQWINYLNVVATVAPMIGLLGTVSGMIGAFQTIARGGMGRPELLAGDIGEALITTATGLVIGIPAMIAYFVLRNRLNLVVLETVQTASKLIDSLGRPQAPIPTGPNFNETQR